MKNKVKPEMTVKEMARMGGLATKAKHPDHFSKMGKKGRRVPPKDL